MRFNNIIPQIYVRTLHNAHTALTTYKTWKDTYEFELFAGRLLFLLLPLRNLLLRHYSNQITAICKVDRNKINLF